MHPDYITLHAYLDHELVALQATDVADHLATCEVCQRRLSDISALTAHARNALAALDVATPVVDFGRVRRGTAAARVTTARLTPQRMRWAAAATLALAVSGIALAAPSSPVRAWLRRVFVADTPSGRAAGESAPNASAVPPASVGRSGIAVVPGRRLRIEFEAWQSAGTLTIVSVDSAALSISAPAGSAAFTSEPTVLRVANAGATADFRIALPRAASDVEVRVAGRRVFGTRRADAGIAPALDSTGTRLISLVQPTASSQIRR